MEGTQFGRYQLLELLGRGGMGEVWRARDTATDRVVAVKVLLPHWADDDVFQQRFRREAHAAASLNEPHVVPIHDYGEIDGRLYVDMRLIDGRDLHSIIAEGPQEPHRAIHIVEQVAMALEAAHDIGLVHRDVKPSNVLVTKFDFTYLIDFGIAQASGQAKLTQVGSTMGTWHYMSPERFTTGETDKTADIYALACVLHEALTGAKPFPGDSFEQQVTAHLQTQPPRPSNLVPGLSPAMDAVIAKGMAKNPTERYRTATEFTRAAKAALQVPPEASGPTVIHQRPASLNPPSGPTRAPAYGPPGGGAPPTPATFAAHQPYPPQQYPPYQPPGGPPPSGPPHAGPPPKGNRNTIIAVSAAAAVILVVVAIVLIFALQPSDTPTAGGDTSTTSSRSSSSRSTSTTSSDTTTRPSNGLQPTIADYVSDSGATETAITPSDKDVPALFVPIPPGWADMPAKDVPDGYYGGATYSGTEFASQTPKILALYHKLVGDVDTDKLLDAAPGELENLNGWQPDGAGSRTTIGGHPGYRLSGTWADGGTIRVIAQMTAVAPMNDGLYILQINAYAMPESKTVLDTALDVVFAQTTIG